MKCKVRYSPTALNDLDEIHDYIAGELSNPDAAFSLIERLLKAMDRLAMYPESGAALSSILRVPGDYRFIPVEQYLVFYRVQPEEVYIDRILYGKRDYLRLLFDLDVR